MFLWTVLLVIDKHNRMILPRFVELLLMRINSFIWKDINCVLRTVEDLVYSCGICGGQCDTGTDFSPRTANLFF